MQERMDARILLVDDSPALIDALSDILSGQGYQIESCNNGESGWSRLVAGAEKRASMPDLLLLDLMMPGVDGMTLLSRIRTDERFALLPVIVLTVQTDAETRMEALKTGASDYLAKPVHTAELLARVKAFLGWKLAERRQQRRMERLIEAGRLLLSTLELDTVLQRVMQIVTVEMDAEGGSIWLQTATGGLECRAAFGSSAKGLLGIRLKPGQGIAGWALQHRQSALVSNAQADPRFCQTVDTQVSFLTRDLIAVPLLVRQSGIGVLEAVNRTQEPFSPADLAWLEVLAPLAAAAIANAQLFQALRRRTEELQARSEELDAFAHTVAHDLQNPLTLVIGFAEALERDHGSIPDEQVQEYLQTIAQTGRKMGNIVEELLLLAQLRKMEVKTSHLDMAGITGAALERLAHLARECKAEIVLPDTWPGALGYGPWIEEVWINYISNALKYGGRPPRVELGATVQLDGMVRFWVRDNGPGLAPEAQARLFTPFTQLDQADPKGHGLGLSIVRRIVEKLGGQVGVESQMGRGSIFAFTLPGVASVDSAATKRM
jgi:signal transduction histidine kinase